MDLRTIEQLLNRYFDAETTTAEERQLKEYFSSQDVAPHLQKYKPMFGYFVQEAKPEFNRELPLRTKRNYGKWISVAASLVLMMGMFAYFTLQSGTGAADNDLGTYDDPEVAFRETQKALNMVSKNVNVGVNSINYIGEYEKSRKTIFKE
jgi:hypothetical protein